MEVSAVWPESPTLELGRQSTTVFGRLSRRQSRVGRIWRLLGGHVELLDGGGARAVLHVAPAASWSFTSTHGVPRGSLRGGLLLTLGGFLPDAWAAVVLGLGCLGSWRQRVAPVPQDVSRQLLPLGTKGRPCVVAALGRLAILLGAGLGGGLCAAVGRLDLRRERRHSIASWLGGMRPSAVFDGRRERWRSIASCWVRCVGTLAVPAGCLE